MIIYTMVGEKDHKVHVHGEVPEGPLVRIKRHDTRAGAEMEIALCMLADNTLSLCSCLTYWQRTGRFQEWGNYP